MTIKQIGYRTARVHVSKLEAFLDTLGSEYHVTGIAGVYQNEVLLVLAKGIDLPKIIAEILDKHDVDSQAILEDLAWRVLEELK